MNKEKKIGVSKVVIQMGDKEATLTVEQAKELRDALNALLGEKVVERVVERDRWYPYNPYNPYNPYVYPKYWTVTVGDQPGIYGTTTGGNATSGLTAYLTSNNGDPLPV